MADGRRHGALLPHFAVGLADAAPAAVDAARSSSWIAVGISATAAGILLGIAADKMLYESYGTGGWLQWGALLAAGIARAAAVRPTR